MHTKQQEYPQSFSPLSSARHYLPFFLSSGDISAENTLNSHIRTHLSAQLTPPKGRNPTTEESRPPASWPADPEDPRMQAGFERLRAVARKGPMNMCNTVRGGACPQDFHACSSYHHDPRHTRVRALSASLGLPNFRTNQEGATFSRSSGVGVFGGVLFTQNGYNSCDYSRIFCGAGGAVSTS